MTDAPDSSDSAGGDAPSSPTVDRALLEILVEPGTHAPLRYDRARQLLISDRSGLAYLIRDGIPIMLADEAVPVDSLDAAPATPAGGDEPAA